MKSGVSLFILISTFNFEGLSNCYEQDNNSNNTILSETSKIYISYGVSDTEGFNSRIDVFIRAANFIKLLPKKQNWILVLPPWENLVHWKSPVLQENLSWKNFFDVKSLSSYLDVIEMSEFLKMKIFKFDKVYVLQSDMRQEVNSENVEVAPCLLDPGYYRDINGLHRGMLGYIELFAEEYHCLSVQGTGRKLLKLLSNSTTTERFVFVQIFKILIDLCCSNSRRVFSFLMITISFPGPSPF